MPARRLARSSHRAGASTAARTRDQPECTPECRHLAGHWSVATLPTCVNRLTEVHPGRAHHANRTEADASVRHLTQEDLQDEHKTRTLSDGTRDCRRVAEHAHAHGHDRGAGEEERDQL